MADSATLSIALTTKDPMGPPGAVNPGEEPPDRVAKQQAECTSRETLQQLFAGIKTSYTDSFAACELEFKKANQYAAVKHHCPVFENTRKLEVDATRAQVEILVESIIVDTPNLKALAATSGRKMTEVAEELVLIDEVFAYFLDHFKRCVSLRRRDVRRASHQKTKVASAVVSDPPSNRADGQGVGGSRSSSGAARGERSTTKGRRDAMRTSNAA